MVSTLLVLAAAAISLALTWALLRGGSVEIRSLEDWEAHKNEIDIEMFRVLVDPGEEYYLRQSFSKLQFRRVLRKRISLALRTLVLIRENAALLTKLGALAKGTDNPALAREAEALSAAALQLRLNLVLMRFCLWIKWLFPSFSVSVPLGEIRYNALLNHLIRLRNYTYREVRIEA
jgi:hypothetical protein